MRHSAGGWWLVLAFVSTFTTQAMPQRSATDANKVTTVVLDAGHGGKDPGNLGNGEKPPGLEIASQRSNAAGLC